MNFDGNYQSNGSAEGRKNVLILCDGLAADIGTVKDHLSAFKNYSCNNIFICDLISAAQEKMDLKLFDVVVLHYSLVISSSESIPPKFSQAISAYDGYKVLFIQDEYRWVDRTAAAVCELGIDVIYSVVNKDVVDQIYHHVPIRGVRRKLTLTGFVPEELTRRDVLEFADRPVDVGYRARRVPAWLGQFAQEKWQIGQRFKGDAKRYRLKCDIDHKESRRLYGERWISFISRCKAVLGTESGASFVDFNGSVQPAVEHYERLNPGASFEEIRSRFLKDDGNIIIRVISPRCFEAAALRTLMILYPGEYSGALEPWRHYVPLARDHSNMEEVVGVLKNTDRARDIINNAYHEVALNKRWSFRAMVEEFDSDLKMHTGLASLECGSGGNRAEFNPQQSDISLAELTKLEYRVHRRFRYQRRLVLKTRKTAYVGIHWIIRRTVPAHKQEAVIDYIRHMLVSLKSSP